MKFAGRALGILLAGLLFPCAVHAESPRGSAAGSLRAGLRVGKHLFTHYCAVCHGLSGKGNGVNAGNLDPHPSDLTGAEATKLSDREIYEVIEKGGGAVELSVEMPPWGRTLSPSQIRALVAYIRVLGNPKASLEEGAQIRFFQLQTGGEETCPVCHIKAAGGPPIAPNLGHAGSKLNSQWLYQFLKNPQRVRPVGFIPLTKARMPNFYFSDEELRALTEFLMTQRDRGISATAARGVVRSAAEAERGRRLFVDKYGCPGCHRTGGQEGGIVGPDLTMAPRRLKPEWVYYWLKNPQAIRPDSPMPDFGLPDSEIYSLIAYVLSLEEGKSKGTPVSAPFPAPFASPLPPAEGAFGTPLVSIVQSPSGEWVKKGEKLVKDKNCVACHTLDPFNSQARQRR